ncbi:VIR protein [Plasmodium vivax]|uniref:VIR protein n=1 Tax=Plasmodium vivax TaxID=5855 RepID=A0A1G4EDD1_PLAVI|nr:VIR protein [Plasmodium vivax]
MTCYKPFNEYLDYECYDKLYERFFLKNLEFTEAVTNFSNTYKIPDTKKNSLLQEILPKLKKYLSDDNSFVSYNQLYICKYISYLLYDQICKGDNNVCDKDIFNILKDFVEGFRLYKKSNICMSKINYLDTSTYKKHSILYDLYDKYSIIIRRRPSNPYLPCSTLNSLIFNYNETIRIHGENDVHFIDKLIELKKLIADKVLPSNTNCGRLITHFTETNIEKARAEAHAEKLRQEAAKAEAKKRLQETVYAVQEQQQVKTEAGQEREQSVVRPEDEITLLEPQGLALKFLVQQESYEESKAHIKQPLVERFTLPDTISDELNEQFYGPENTRATLPGSEEGILEKMKSAISGIGEYVEPVPLMGVSGGMGALFLLLRYTPVATFFRGGRGRAHRIPRSFHGHFPGAFPDYHEYDGGYIGYGPMNINPLAE